MFSRIAEALRKMNAVTLDQLRRVIHNSYTPSPVTVYRENICDIKSWLRGSTATLKHHSNPHAFRFKLNVKGQVEMTYRNWAVAERKEWLPKEGPFIILEELPQGNPSLQRPDNRRCPSPEEIEGFLRHVSVRMNPEEVAWWEKFLAKETERRREWEEMTDGDYQEAGEAFDLWSMQYESPPLEKETRDEAYKKREAELRVLIEKKYTFPPVSIMKAF